MAASSDLGAFMGSGAIIGDATECLPALNEINYVIGMLQNDSAEKLRPELRTDLSNRRLTRLPAENVIRRA